ncbi:MAG: hypothetical protein ACI8P0_000335 [Planctomycetaceae bacterium]|jgi:hypothetical protein
MTEQDRIDENTLAAVEYCRDVLEALPDGYSIVCSTVMRGVSSTAEFPALKITSRATRLAEPAMKWIRMLFRLSDSRTSIPASTACFPSTPVPPDDCTLHLSRVARRSQSIRATARVAEPAAARVLSPERDRRLPRVLDITGRRRSLTTPIGPDKPSGHPSTECYSGIVFTSRSRSE